MDGPLAWQNLVFLIPLVFGILLMLGALLGFDSHAEADVGHDVGHGAEHDAGHDAHHDHDGGALKAALSILGVGRIPLMLLCTLMALFFGLTGYFMNVAIAPALKSPWVYFWISFAVAFVAMVALTGLMARVIGRVMPKTVLHKVDDADLEGRVGRLAVPADDASGFVDVRDSIGNMHRVRCRTEKDPLPTGSEVLLIEYEASSRTYVVQPHDAGALTETPARSE
jgi:membrane protein implicated in regulation of membrane protease activity